MNLISVFFPLILLAVAGAVAFYFTPQKSISFAERGVYTLSENEYSLRVYTDENNSNLDFGMSSRPLLIILPPAFGSLPVIDETACELRDRGFTVIACDSRSGLLEQFRRGHTFFSGSVYAGANKKGRLLEEKRKKDAQFVLSWIKNNPRIEGTTRLFDLASKDNIFIAGYDASGSALILSEASLFRNITISGMIAIEAPLWSLYRSAADIIPDISASAAVNAGWFQSVKLGVKRWYVELMPNKISDLEQIPRVSTPILFLVSDWSRDPKFSNTRYKALLGCFAAAQNYAVLATEDGAGPLGFSDFPIHYPLVTTILKGRLESRFKPTRSNFEIPWRTAATITNFAASVLSAREGTSWPLRNSTLPAGVQVKTK